MQLKFESNAEMRQKGMFFHQLEAVKPVARLSVKH